ncbi:uncharacterized protein LOC135117150 [Helicoverpa armigera]|uniref:uncharacterized protein LOC135117150 n=1 Tax=Helicoverpa armigera TaxID=29058 RepID=UPI003082A47B
MISFVQRLEIITFCKYIDLLSCRLQIINKYLKTFVDEQNRKSVTVFTMESKTIRTKETVNFIGNASESNTKIRDLAQMYGMIAHTCERLLSVRNETKILVNKIIMNYDLPTTMRDQAKAFMELVEAWPLHIHIYDMFSVDITLMLKFISVATTYFIVVIQSTILVNKIIMNYDLPTTMRDQAKAFMQLVEAWPLRIHIYDMFSVDITRS